jgi:hypothetical protein
MEFDNKLKLMQVCMKFNPLVNFSKKIQIAHLKDLNFCSRVIFSH